MSAQFSVFVPVDPFGKQRPRIGKWGAFTPKKTIEYEETIKQCCEQKIAQLGHSKFEQGVCANIVFYMPIPKSYTKKRREQIASDPSHTNKPDLDNLAKAVLDAMNGIVYADDCLIKKIELQKLYAVDGVAGIHIQISQS